MKNVQQKVVRQGKASAPGAPPPITTAGALMGVWPHERHLVRVNEFTARQREYHERWPFAELLK